MVPAKLAGLELLLIKAPLPPTPVPEMVKGFAPIACPPRSRVAPAVTLTALDVLPSALELPSASVPALTATLPVNVSASLSSSTPAPLFGKALRASQHQVHCCRVVIDRNRRTAGRDGEREDVGRNAVVIENPVVARRRIAEFQLADRPRGVEMDRIVGGDIERAEVGDAVGPVGHDAARPVRRRRPQPAAGRVDPRAVGGQGRAGPPQVHIPRRNKK